MKLLHTAEYLLVVLSLRTSLVCAVTVISNSTIFTDFTGSFDGNSTIHVDKHASPGRFDPLTQGAELEVAFIYTGGGPTAIGITASSRMFSSFPRVNVENVHRHTVAELLSDGKEKMYPSEDYNFPPGGAVNYSTTPPTGASSEDHLVSVQSLLVDSANRLWLLDTGRPTDPKTSLLCNSVYGGPKLVGVDLTTNQVFRTILFPTDVAYPDSYLNDLVLDLRSNVTVSGKGIAYITDSSNEGRNGIVVVDLDTGKSWRKLEGLPEVRAERGFVSFPWGGPYLNNPGTEQPVRFTSTGIDGIAISPNGETLYFSPNSARTLYSIPTKHLRSTSISSDLIAASSISNHGQKGHSDGMQADSNGLLYMGNSEASGIYTFNPETASLGLLTRDVRLGWVDSFDVTVDGWIYFTTIQYHLQGLFQGGTDRRRTPYILYKTRTINGGKKIM